MPDTPVPASRRVRASRVRFIADERLERRLAWFYENREDIARAIDGRKPMRDLAREILTIERELARRAAG